MNRMGEKLSKARNLLLADVIDTADYKLIKIETEEKMKRLESKLAVMNNKKHSQAQIEKLMEKAISTLSKLDTHYQNAQVTKKREIVSSIFHGKFIFDGKDY